MEKGEVLAEYDAADEETLLLTVPDENGWDLYINGKKSTNIRQKIPLSLFRFPKAIIPSSCVTMHLDYVQVFFPVFWLLDFFLPVTVTKQKKTLIYITFS